MTIEPALSPNGNTVFVLSTRPDSAAGGKPGNHDIWAVTRPTGGWTAPRSLRASRLSTMPLPKHTA
jgi:hypothetical protein